MRQFVAGHIIPCSPEISVIHKHCPGLFLDFASGCCMLFFFNIYFGWLFNKVCIILFFHRCFMEHRLDLYVENSLMFVFWIRPMEETLFVKTWSWLFFLALISCKAQDVGQKERNPANLQLQLRSASVISGVQHQLTGWTAEGLECWGFSGEVWSV